MKRKAVASFGFLLVLSLSQIVSAYFEDFENSVGPEWSKSTIATTPIGERHFLGEFGSETVSLSLTNLAAHTEIILSFDLFILKSWDGQGPEGDPSGPDIWSITADNSNFSFTTTFSNHYPGTSYIYPEGKEQKYPNQWPDGANMPAFSGASEINTLGYHHPDRTWIPMDAIYRLSFTFEHSAESLVINFMGNLTNEIWNESWGLDNVSVYLIPEPATFLLLGLGVVMARRKR